MIKIFMCFLLGCDLLILAKKNERILYGKDLNIIEIDRYYSNLVYVEICILRECNYCTGTLVKSDRILLAARCFCMTTDEIPIVTTWVNTRSKKDGGIKRSGYRIKFVLPEYNCNISRVEALENDVALVALHDPIIQLHPINLYCQETSDTMNIEMLGYGFDEKNLRGNLKIALGETVYCPNQWMKRVDYFDRLVCLKGGNGVARTTAADTGGPMLVQINGRRFQLGVSSAMVRYFDITVHDMVDMAVWNSVTDNCKYIMDVPNTPYYPDDTNSAWRRSAVGLMGVLIQSFVTLIVLNF